MSRYEVADSIGGQGEGGISFKMAKWLILSKRRYAKWIMRNKNMKNFV